MAVYCTIYTYPSVAGRHYESLNTTVTFEKDDLVATRRVKLVNNQQLENSRMFSAVIEVTPGLLFPAQVQNSSASIEIEDDDSECRILKLRTCVL